MSKKTSILPLIVLGFVCFVLYNEKAIAQTIKISGKLVNARNQNEGVPGIRVRVLREGVEIKSSPPSNGKGEYSVEISSGSPISLHFRNSEWWSTPITNLPADTNLFLPKALTRVGGIASFTPAEAADILGAALYYQQQPAQYSTELAQFSSINKSRFPQEFRQTATSMQTETLLVAKFQERFNSIESRIAQVEGNSQRLSGQFDEMAAVSSAARGGAKAAQDTADAAVAGVNATNDRINALDDYVVEKSLTILFESDHAELTPAAKSQLDALAKSITALKGYTFEVLGFTNSSGNAEKNQQLSQQRAENVARYLVVTHSIPVRRMAMPFGYGAERPVADNSTPLGRAQNNRAEVRVLVNRGLQQGSN